MSHLISSAVLIAALLSSAPSALAARPIPESRLVPYGDLDLSKSAGVGEIMKRLDRAAELVCGGRPSGTAVPQFMRRFKACKEEAVSAAVRSLDHPTVTEAWLSGSDANRTHLASR